MNLASASIATDADLIFNWAENNFDQFPTHETTQTFEPWLFRHYPATNIYAGVNKIDKGVYVQGGVFGNEPLYIDTVENVLKLAFQDGVDTELERRQLSDILKSIAQAESDIDLRPETGIWTNPKRPVSGVEIHLSADQLFLLWRTFDAKGLAVWYLAVSKFDGTKHWSAALLQFTFDQSRNTANATPVGSVELEFFDGKRAAFSWDLEGSNGTELIELLITSEVRPTSSLTGIYVDPANPVWGVTANLQGTILTALVYGYDQNGMPRWFMGTAPKAPVESADSITVDLFSYSEGTGPNTEYKTPVANPGGTVTLVLDPVQALNKAESNTKQQKASRTEAVESSRKVKRLTVNALNFGDQSVFHQAPPTAFQVSFPVIRVDINGPTFVNEGATESYSAEIVFRSLIDEIGFSSAFLWAGDSGVQVKKVDSSSTEATFSSSTEATFEGSSDFEPPFIFVKVKDVNPQMISRMPDIVRFLEIDIIDSSKEFAVRIVGNGTVWQGGVGNFYVSRQGNGVPPFKYKWTFEDGIQASERAVDPTTERKASHTFEKLGTAFAKVTVTDSSNPVKTATAEHKIIVERVIDDPNNSLLKVDWLGQSPETLLVNEVGTWTVEVDGGVPPYEVVFDFGDGNLEILKDRPAGDYFARHQFDMPGNKSVQVSVTDDEDNFAATSIRNVRVNTPLAPPPTIKIVKAHPKLATFEEATWEIEVQGGNPPHEAFVEWGDGSGTIIPLSETGENFTGEVEHFYKNPGTFTIEFRVTDSKDLVGTGSSSVVVEDKPPPSSCQIDKLDPPCTGGYLEIKNAGLEGSNEEIHDVKFAECQSLCDENDWCKSFDYHETSIPFPGFPDRCFLSKENRCDGPQLIKGDNPFSYYENCAR